MIRQLQEVFSQGQIVFYLATHEKYEDYGGEIDSIRAGVVMCHRSYDFYCASTKQKINWKHVEVQRYRCSTKCEFRWIRTSWQIVQQCEPNVIVIPASLPVVWEQHFRINHYGIEQFLRSRAIKTKESQEDNLEFHCQRTSWQKWKQDPSCRKGLKRGTRKLFI